MYPIDHRASSCANAGRPTGRSRWRSPSPSCAVFGIGRIVGSAIKSPEQRIGQGQVGSARGGQGGASGGGSGRPGQGDPRDREDQGARRGVDPGPRRREQERLHGDDPERRHPQLRVKDKVKLDLRQRRVGAAQRATVRTWAARGRVGETVRTDVRAATARVPGSGRSPIP